MTIRAHRSLHRARGLSLLELIVTLAITTGTLLALYQVSGNSLSAAIETGRKTQALIAAESILGLVQAAPSGGLHEEGTLDEAGTMKWRLSTAPAEPSLQGTEVTFHRIEIEVFWGTRGVTRSVTLVSLIPQLD